MALIDNLVGYWPLDEASGDAIDAHAALDLTETGGTIASTTGKVSNCRDFEEVDTEWFERADSSDFSRGDTDFSFAGWINAESLTGFPFPFSKDNGASQREYGVYFSSSVPRFYVSAAGSTLVEAVWGSSLSTATWYFLACGHSAAANETWISINAGTPVTQSHSTGVFDGTTAFQLGAASALGRYWDGLLDEWGLWGRDIRSDVSELYNAGAGRDYAYIAGGAANTKRRDLMLLGVGC